METPKIPKYSCIKCCLTTNNKKDWYKHLSTAKHLLSQGISNLETNLSPKSPDDKFFLCKICNISYQTRSGLWKHSKICKEPLLCEVVANNDIKELKEIIFKLVDHNNELTKQMISI